MTVQNLSDIHTVVVHCSASRPTVWVDVSTIDRWHKERRFPAYVLKGEWHHCGYHEVIRLDGIREHARPLTVIGAHVKGNNVNTIGVCMVGGINSEGKSADTFSVDQYDALYAFLWWAHGVLPGLKRIVGHRDLSPDLNGDGQITREEWLKDCPCFDVRKKLVRWGLSEFAAPFTVDVRDIV